MKAAIVDRYGPPEVVRVGEVPMPEPKENEVLIQVYAASVSSGDWRLRSGSFPDGMGFLAKMAMGFSGPRNKVLGNDLCGVVVKTGAQVRRFAVGDRVIAQGGAGGGGHAEYKVMAEDGTLALAPANLGFEQAGAMGFGGGTALHFLGKANLRAGEKLLINGASGSVGTAMVQIGKHMGAEVTAVCSGANAELVRGLGADHVADYTKVDFASGAERYDVIADVVGTSPYHDAKAVLKRGGRFLIILGDAMALLGFVRPDKVLEHQVIGGVAAESSEALAELTRLAEAGVFAPVIDATFPLARVVDAHRRVDSGRKRGNVVLTMPVMDRLLATAAA